VHPPFGPICNLSQDKLVVGILRVQWLQRWESKEGVALNSKSLNVTLILTIYIYTCEFLNVLVIMYWP
jgi:hypothetical protein